MCSLQVVILPDLHFFGGDFLPNFVEKQDACCTFLFWDDLDGFSYTSISVCIYIYIRIPGSSKGLKF